MVICDEEVRPTEKRQAYEVRAYHSGRGDLRHEISSPAETFGSWVRVPFEAWMPVGVYSLFVLPCVGTSLAMG